MKSLSRFYLFSVILCFFIGSVNAEQKKVFDGPDGSEYEIHYIGFTSTFLDPEVAKQYDIVRSRALGIVNISVIKVEKVFPEGSVKPLQFRFAQNFYND